MLDARRCGASPVRSPGLLLTAIALAAIGCSTPPRIAPSPLAPADSVERVTHGIGGVAVAARQGLGIVVLVRGRRAPAIVTLRPDDAALWSARASLWIDATHGRQLGDSEVLRSEPTSSPGWALFLERGVVRGRPTLALYAADTSGAHGTVVEFTEPELRDVLTSIWSVASERDSTLLAPELLGGDTVWSERAVTKPARPGRTRASPHYPDGLIARGVEGSVVLSFVVDTSGAIVLPTIEVLDATRPAFRDAVLDFARRVRFEPAEQAGRKVRLRCLMPFGFSVGTDPRDERIDVLLIADRTPPWYASP